MGSRETKGVVSELFFELVPWFYHLSHSRGPYYSPYRSIGSGRETKRKSPVPEIFWTYSQILICRGKICFLADYAVSPLHPQLLFLGAGDFFHTVYREVVAPPTVGCSQHFQWPLDHCVCCEFPLTSEISGLPGISGELSRAETLPDQQCSPCSMSLLWTLAPLLYFYTTFFLNYIRGVLSVSNLCQRLQIFACHSGNAAEP